MFNPHYCTKTNVKHVENCIETNIKVQRLFNTLALVDFKPSPNNAMNFENTASIVNGNYIVKCKLLQELFLIIKLLH